MALLLPDQMADFVNLTLSKFERTKWVDISLDYQDFIVASRLFTAKKMRRMAGKDYNWKLQVRNTGTARHTEMFDIDKTDVKDLTIEASMPYSKQTVNWSYDVDEQAFQTSPEEIVDIISVRRHSAYNDYFSLMEDALWSSPTSASQAPRPPSGIPFWLQKNAVEGFNGGNPAGFPEGCAGVNADTYPNWKNRTFAFEDVTRDDLIAKLKRAHRFCNFKAPHSFPELGAGQRYELFTVNAVIEQFEVFVESRNDNLGTDLGKQDGGDITFKRAPIIWVPYLEDNDQTEPIYGLNWDTFYPCTKKGASGSKGLEWTKPLIAPNQHTTRNVFGDGWSQYVCNNRRSNFVGYNSTK